MIPKPSDSMLCYRIIIVTRTIVGKDGELILGHYVSVWLSLYSSPGIADTPLEQSVYCRRDLAILVFFGNLKRLS